MLVYVVELEPDYDDNDVVGVYTTLARARLATEDYCEHTTGVRGNKWNMEDFQVTPVDLDEFYTDPHDIIRFYPSISRR